MDSSLLFSYILLQFGFPWTLQDIFINELNADTPNTDIVEYIELWNSGSCPQILDGYNLVFFNGHSDPADVYMTLNLSGYCIDGDGYMLIGSPSVIPTPDITPFSSNGIQNGLGYADAVGLYKNYRVPSVPTRDDLVDAVIYDKDQPSQAGAFFPELMDVEPVIHEKDTTLVGDESISRCSTVPRTLSSYAIGATTPGTINFCGSLSQHAVAYPCSPTQLSNDEPQHMLRNSRFKYLKNTLVNGAVILHLNVRSVIQCATECTMRKTCFRFNYLRHGYDSFNCVLFPECGISFSISSQWLVGEKI